MDARAETAKVQGKGKWRRTLAVWDGFRGSNAPPQGVCGGVQVLWEPCGWRHGSAEFAGGWTTQPDWLRLRGCHIVEKRIVICATQAIVNGHRSQKSDFATSRHDGKHNGKVFLEHAQGCPRIWV